jgi:hypothetical protein
MNVGEIGCQGRDWIYLALDRVHWCAFVNIAINCKWREFLE